MKGIRNGWMAACVCWGACGFVSAQEFTLEGRVPGMRDGVNVALLCNHKTLAETRVKDGAFRLRGKRNHRGCRRFLLGCQCLLYRGRSALF